MEASDSIERGEGGPLLGRDFSISRRGGKKEGVAGTRGKKGVGLLLKEGSSNRRKGDELLRLQEGRESKGISKLKRNVKRLSRRRKK